jgi:hypothetical protein
MFVGIPNDLCVYLAMIAHDAYMAHSVIQYHKYIVLNVSSPPKKTQTVYFDTRYETTASGIVLLEK